MNFNRNNLDSAASPYLRQHKDNPVFWQEWNRESLDYAKSSDRPLFLSIGYATCHWCHVMAAEAFSDQIIADYINNNFVAIKVDREQRPDIDRFAMKFIIATEGRGGWPLNVALSPSGDPFFAGTYFPVEARGGMPAFLDILSLVHKYYLENKENIKPVPELLARDKSADSDESAVLAVIRQNFDKEYYGFGRSAKFPPHNTLLFLLFYFEVGRDAGVEDMIIRTLDAMAERGLHDHLQGGFFRYCTDRGWTIPHFEKMLYDQAMLLWVYALSFKLFGRPEDKIVVGKIMKSLEETFRAGHYYISGLDADTDHHEGATYLWDYEELQGLLTAEEFKRFKEVYDLSDGEFEGKIHLIKQSNTFLPSIEEKLLAVRVGRRQPAADKKIITSWNALAGIGLLMAYRYADHPEALDQAVELTKALLNDHYLEGKLIHSSFGGVRQDEGFLEDYAAMTLLLSYIYEENGLFRDELEEFLGKTKLFYRDGGWLTNIEAADFFTISADNFDHPQPSAVSLAEMALYRAAILLELEEREEPVRVGPALSRDFHNIVALLAKDGGGEIHAPELIDWSNIPITFMQIRGEGYKLCQNYQCQAFSSLDALFSSLSGE